MISKNADLFARINSVEKRQIRFEITTESKFKEVFAALDTHEPKQGIFYDSQVFDAYLFVSGLVRKAKTSIILIDNYVDDSVLTLFSKRNSGVSVTIYTRNISKQLNLDVEKFTKQYGSVKIKEFKAAHDRFLMIDENEIYHFGASLKDLGKKWFAFTKFETGAVDMLRKLC